MSNAQVLVVDDEADIRALIQEILSEEGYGVTVAANAEEARSARRNANFDLILLDIWMPDTDGITLLREWSDEADLKCPVVIMSGHGTVDTAVEATRLGAHDFLEKPLSLGALIAFSAPSAGLGFVFFLATLYLLKFSTDVLFLSPALMGALIGLSKLWDAVSDPLAGYLSDRTRSPMGRRRPWMFASAVPLALAFTWLWSPPEGLGAGGLAAWLGIGLFFFYTAQTAFAVPHLSLGAELSRDHHERTRVFGGRVAEE